MLKANNDKNLSIVLEKYPINMQLLWQNPDGKADRLLPSFSFPKGFAMDSEAHAKALALGMHLKVAERLGGQQDKDKAKPLAEWSYKKAISHTEEVAGVAQEISSFPAFKDGFVRDGADMKEVERIMMINTWLHDIGRQGEIDFANLQTVELGSLRGDKSLDHAFESSQIIRSAGVTDPKIILPVKYHGLMKYREQMAEDPMFAKLSEKEQAGIVRLTDGLRDADKAANLMSKAKNGMAGVGELNNPKYLADYTITPETLQGLVSGEGCSVAVEGHRLDAMLRWLSWGDQFVYPTPAVTKLISELWERTFEHAKAEFEASTDKDQARYQATIASLKNAREIQMARLTQGKDVSKTD